MTVIFLLSFAGTLALSIQFQLVEPLLVERLYSRKRQRRIARFAVPFSLSRVGMEWWQDTWKLYKRDYKKYCAWFMKRDMSWKEFNAWAEQAIIRRGLAVMLLREVTPRDERAVQVETLWENLNRLVRCLGSNGLFFVDTGAIHRYRFLWILLYGEWLFAVLTT